MRQKYSETYDFDSISNLLGMEKTSFSSQEEEGSGLVHLYVNFNINVLIQRFYKESNYIAEFSAF